MSATRKDLRSTCLIWHLGFSFKVLGCIAFSLSLMILSSNSVAQQPNFQPINATPVFPTSEYRVAKLLMFDGRTAAASHSFETAYRAARSYNDQHGIDSVPSLCRDGQAIYLGGNLATGLSTIEAGLQLSITNRFWLQYISPITITLRSVQTDDNGLQTFAQFGNSQSVMSIDGFPVLLSRTNGIPESQPLDNSRGSSRDAATIDAIEIYLSQAMAMRIRNKILGKQTMLWPLSSQLLTMYQAPMPALMPDILRRAHNICTAISLRAMNDNNRASIMLLQNVQLDNGSNHPLTGVALLELASIALEQSKFEDARLRASQAAMIAGGLEQADVLCDAMRLFAHISDYMEPGSATAMSENMVRWSEDRYRLVYLTALETGIESASLVKNTGLEKRWSVQLQKAIRDREVNVPAINCGVELAALRSQLFSADTKALQMRWSKISLNANGANSGSPLLPQWIQLDRLQVALKQGQIGTNTIMSHMANLVKRPTTAEIIADPWQSTLWDHQSLASIYSDLFRNAQREGNTDVAIGLLSDWKERQQRISTPFLSQAAAVRTQLTRPNPAKELELTIFQQRYAPMRIRHEQILRAWEAFAQTVKSDTSSWTIEQHRQWSGLQNEIAALQNEYIFAGMLPVPVPDQEAKPFDFAAIRKKLGTNQAILGLHSSPNFIAGYLICQDKSHLWTIDNPRKLYEKNEQLLQVVAAYGTVQDLWKSVNEKADWTTAANELSDALLPKAVRDQLASITQLKIIAHEQTWGIPFELLINDDSQARNCWIAKHRISYANHLKFAGFESELKAPPVASTTILEKSNFFTRESDSDTQLLEQIKQSINGNAIQTISLNRDLPPSWNFPIIKSDRLIAACESSVANDHRLSVLGSRNQPLSISSTMNLELKSPQQIILLGLVREGEKNIRSDAIGLANWLETYQSSTTKMVLARQWPGSGESSATIVREFLSRIDGSPNDADSALQASILNCWEYQFSSANQPRFGNSSRRSDARLLSGDMPLLWGGWKLITFYPLESLKTDAVVAQDN